MTIAYIVANLSGNRSRYLLSGVLGCHMAVLSRMSTMRKNGDVYVALGRAIESCKSLKINVDDHFRELTKMIPTAKGAHRPIQDFMLTRYACYLIAQNGDPKKEEFCVPTSFF